MCDTAVLVESVRNALMFALPVSQHAFILSLPMFMFTPYNHSTVSIRCLIQHLTPTASIDPSGVHQREPVQSKKQRRRKVDDILSSASVYRKNSGTQKGYWSTHRGMSCRSLAMLYAGVDAKGSRGDEAQSRIQQGENKEGC